MGKKRNKGQGKSAPIQVEIIRAPKQPQQTKTENKRFQPHFRKFHDKKTTGHPQYVYDEQGREYKILGITSSPETNGVLNVELKCNPEPKNIQKAYVRPKPDKINKGVRNEKLKGWKLSKKDKKTVRTIIDTHDKKKT